MRQLCAVPSVRRSLCLEAKWSICLLRAPLRGDSSWATPLAAENVGSLGKLLLFLHLPLRLRLDVAALESLLDGPFAVVIVGTCMCCATRTFDSSSSCSSRSMDDFRNNVKQQERKSHGLLRNRDEDVTRMHSCRCRIGCSISAAKEGKQ